MLLDTLNPTPDSDAKLPEVNASKLEPGEYTEVNFRRWKVFVLRKWNNEIKVYTVPFDYQKDFYMLPDWHWWRPTFRCKSFGPEIENNKLKKSGQFKCHDKDWYSQKPKSLMWDYDGITSGKYTDNMETPPYKLTNTHLVIGKYE